LASREASNILAVDMNEYCTKFIRTTSEKLGFNNLRVIRKDVLRFIKKDSGPYDIIYADPPYQMKGIPKMADQIISSNLLNEGGWFILEHSGHLNLPDHPRVFDRRTYGNVNYTIYT
jgi:16S rRNA G966 N2-methylase RsmD